MHRSNHVTYLTLTANLLVLQDLSPSASLYDWCCSRIHQSSHQITAFCCTVISLFLSLAKLIVLCTSKVLLCFDCLSGTECAMNVALLFLEH